MLVEQPSIANKIVIQFFLFSARGVFVILTNLLMIQQQVFVSFIPIFGVWTSSINIVV